MPISRFSCRNCALLLRPASGFLSEEEEGNGEEGTEEEDVPLEKGLSSIYMHCFVCRLKAREGSVFRSILEVLFRVRALDWRSH